MHSKRTILSILPLVFLVLTTTPTHGQAPPHIWSQSFGASGDDHSRGCVVDGNGNTIVVGFFTDKTDFGGGPVVSLGEEDACIVKYDPAGAPIWSRILGGPETQMAVAVAVDANNNIYVTGYYAGTADFGDGPVTSAGDYDIFLIRLDSSGGHVWSKSFGDPDPDMASSLTVDGPGNYVYLTGRFETRLDLGGGDLVSAGSSDIFMAKLKTSNGNHEWSRSFGGSEFDNGYAVTLDAAGNVLITGACEGPIDLGGGIVSGPGGSDIFMAKYDLFGIHIWSRVLGGHDGDYGFDIEVDGSDEILLTGYFYGDADLGGGILGGNGANDIFLAKYDAGGGHIWSQSFGGTKNDRGTAIALNDMNEVFVTGSFEESIDFGGGPLVSNGSQDIFLAKFKASGVHLWSQRFGSDDPDEGTALATDGDSNVIMAGYLQGWTTLGGGGIYADHYSADAFVASYTTEGVYLWHDRFGGRGTDIARDLAVDTAGNVILIGIKRGTVDFGGGPIIGAGGDDIFVAKFDPGGSHMWSKGIGSINDEEALRVCVDASGNIYIGGEFTTDIDFGGGVVSSSGDVDVFLVKYDPSGAFLWVKTFGDFEEEYFGGVAVDGAGNVILSGGFQGTVDFGGGALTSAGHLDVFLAKYDPSGTHLWSKQFGNPNVDYTTCLTADPSGNIVMGGHFADSIGFGGDPFDVEDPAKFLVEFDAGGSHVWSQIFKTYAAFFHDVIVGPTENITITGSFYDWIDLGGGVVTAAGNQDAFIAHYDTDGNYIWAKAFGDTEPDGGSKVTPTASGGFLAVGFFAVSADFGGGLLMSNGERDAYLAEFNANGTHLWSEHYGEAGRSYGSAVGIDPGGDILLAGGFTDMIDLGGSPLTSTGFDLYLAKLGPVTAVDGQELPLSGFTLRSGNPNPFHGQTQMTLAIPEAARASLGIYGVSGRLLRTLIDRDLSAGSHVVIWDGRDDSGRPVPAGIYFARATAADRRTSLKLVRVE